MLLLFFFSFLVRFEGGGKEITENSVYRGNMKSINYIITTLKAQLKRYSITLQRYQTWTLIKNESTFAFYWGVKTLHKLFLIERNKYYLLVFSSFRSRNNKHSCKQQKKEVKKRDFRREIWKAHERKINWLMPTCQRHSLWRAENKSFLALRHAASLIEFWCFIARRYFPFNFSGFSPMNDK